MASILDSSKLVFSDDNSAIKIAVYSLFPFFIDILTGGKPVIPPGLVGGIVCVMLLIYLGSMLRTLQNSLQEKNYVLTDFNFFKSFFVGVKSLIACGVYVLPSVWIYFYLAERFDTSFLGSKIILGLAYLVAASFLATSLIFYAKKCSIFEGLNPIKVFKNFHEIIVYLVFAALMLALFNIVVSAPFGFAIYGLFGFGKIFDYAVCVILTINLFLLAQNFSQAYFEQIKD